MQIEWVNSPIYESFKSPTEIVTFVYIYEIHIHAMCINQNIMY